MATITGVSKDLTPDVIEAPFRQQVRVDSILEGFDGEPKTSPPANEVELLDTTCAAVMNVDGET